MDIQTGYADSQAFFALPGQLPRFKEDARPQLSLALVTSAPPMMQDFDTVHELHTIFRRVTLSNPDTHEVLTRSDVEKPGIGVMFGLQHPPAKMTLSHLWRLRNGGVRSMAIAYDERTEYGDGFKGDGRLTGSGMKLLEWMSQTGIILDLSHAGHTTARNALDFIEQEKLPLPVMASHSGCHSVFPHPRNLPDDILARLGYIGIPAINFFLKERGDRSRYLEVSEYLNALVNHVMHAMSVSATFASVGIGSDCPHIDMSMREAEIQFGNMQQMLKSNGSFGEYFPDRDPGLIEHGGRLFEILESELFDHSGLHGITAGILGDNFKSFLKRSLPRA
jgi:microsomal dipeptidase-like Zn-dependent dipeptidase